MRFAATLLLAATLVACTDSRLISPDAASERVARTLCGNVPGARLWQRTELYFGLSKPDGSRISEAEYQAFLDQEVTPRFGEGFTVLNGNGQFRGANGEIVREPSKVLVLFYSLGDAKSAAADEVRAAYRTQFQQESVLRVDAPSCVGFL